MSNHQSNQQNNIDIQRLRGMLHQIARLAREASITGSLDSGARSAGQSFNRILQIIEQKGIDLGGLFEPMPAEASFDEIGVAAAQLVGFLEVDQQRATAPEPPHAQQPPATSSLGSQSPHQQHQGEAGGSHFMIDMSQFKDFEQLKGLGQMIREQLPEWIKREVEAKMAASHEHVAQAEEPAHAATRHGTQRLPETASAGRQSTFQDQDMSGARFRDTNLAGAAFRDVNFDNVEFNDVNFSDVSFHDTNFANATFHDTNFDNARFHDATFHNVEIIDSDISGMKINGIAIDDLLRRHEQE